MPCGGVCRVCACLGSACCCVRLGSFRCSARFGSFRCLRLIKCDYLLEVRQACNRVGSIAGAVSIGEQGYIVRI